MRYTQSQRLVRRAIGQWKGERRRVVSGTRREELGVYVDVVTVNELEPCELGLRLAICATK